MYFSGKVTYSAYNFLVRNSSDIEGLYELTDISTELIKDPTCWIDAKNVEQFLEVVDKEFGHLSPDKPLITRIGHSCYELRSWGVLDSVLKMMQDPQDIFGQPQKFLSYFISPAPPVANVQRKKDSVGFDLPLSPEEYPYFAEFLKASLEGLPQYTGKQLAYVKWNHTRLEISWNEAQETLFEKQSEDVNIKPELIRSLIQYLEEAQSDIEQKKRELMVKDQQIEDLKNQSMTSKEMQKHVEQQVIVENMRSQFYRLFDYMGRASQLVTLLVKQDRKDRQVQEAMRRVDWENITQSLPQLREKLINEVEGLVQKNQESFIETSKSTTAEEVSSSLNNLTL
ncbi:MAG: hypothetical protein KDD34_07535 [Bdellovibrionales bacterium]|nr:hypothetical protein [Bdellovibrionales bacterium]